MGERFGTDGVRGTVGISLTAQQALGLAEAAAAVLVTKNPGRRPFAIVGRDPRPSGNMLEAAVTAGLTANGVDVLSVGVVPTPAVAYLVAAWRADFGIIISASHNPMPDNGIKFFGPGGYKLDDKLEQNIEQAWNNQHTGTSSGIEIGRIYPRPDGARVYVQHLLANIDSAHQRPFAGVRIVIDAANGSAAIVGPEVFKAAGAEVYAINTDVSGELINDKCGSTDLNALSQAVKNRGADAGIAFDGDADRCLAVDQHGNVVDGDAILAILGIALHKQGKLQDDTVVATVMSNYGLYQALQQHNIALRTTSVGDRYVLEELRRGGFSLGGEQSGHIVFQNQTTTGDGLLTGLKLIEQMCQQARSLTELASVMKPLPQVLINVAVKDKNSVGEARTVQEALEVAQKKLSGHGRVLLRPSGTEQLFRIMVEAEDPAQAEQVAGNLADIVRSQSSA